MVQPLPIRFGRLVTSVGALTLPWFYAGDIQNIDIDQDGSAKKRKGYVRALSSAMTGKVALVHGFEDYDGTDVFIVVDSTGVRREN